MNKRDIDLYNGQHFTFQVPQQTYAVGSNVVALNNKERLRVVGVTVQATTLGGVDPAHRISIRIASEQIIPAKSSADPAVAAMGLHLNSWTFVQWKAPVDGIFAEQNDELEVVLAGGAGPEVLSIILFCTPLRDSEGPGNRGVEQPDEPIDVRVVT